MINFIKNTLNPQRYHGRVFKPPFFEGWYYKVIDPSGSSRYAFIPGVFIGETPEKSHAFIQVLDGENSEVFYHRYPMTDFWAAEDRFEIRIKNNLFTLEKIQLEIDKAEQSIRGVLSFEKPIAWPVRWTSPGVMGWYAWVPSMECYHGVLGFDHAVSGELEVNQERLNFDGGRGYIEKDWGKSFPQAWIWMQSNHFSQPNTSLTASVAIIPWLGNAFAGFIVGFWQDGQLHRFATYANSRITHLSVNDQQVSWIMQNRTHRLEILAAQAEGGQLLAPTPAGMGRRIAETLSASIAVRLINRRTNQVEFDDLGKYAGLEAVGDMNKLIKMAGLTSE